MEDLHKYCQEEFIDVDVLRYTPHQTTQMTKAIIRFPMRTHFNSWLNMLRKMRLNELSEKVNITLSNLSILKQGKAKAIKLSTLNSICEALNCQPGDILEYQSLESGT